MRQLPLGVRVPDRAVFASFLPGGNAQAIEHLKALAQGTTCGSAWICGPSGSGKSHLLQASCRLASEHGTAAYLPLRELSSLGVGTLEGLVELDSICLDDIDAVVGDLAWEHALFALHRGVEERRGRLIAAASTPPALATFTLRDLGSRWAASAVFQLRALDEQELTRALQLRAHVRGLELPEETALWLQRRFPRDMHTLYGLLDTLDEASLVARRKLTVPFIRSVLSRQA